MSEMTLNEYQSEAEQYAAYDTCDYPFLALAEEAGEVVGKIAKAVRKQGVSMDLVLTRAFTREDEVRDGIAKELGDVLWQLQACCNEIGISLHDVALLNLQKLADRSERGVIVGEGDDR